MNKKLILFFILLVTAIPQTKPCHTAAAVAGAAIGGLAGGFILGRLIGRHDTDVAYWDYKEKQTLKQSSEKQKRQHRAEIKKHEKALQKLEHKGGEKNNKKIKYHQEEIKKHESVIASIDTDTRDYFKNKPAYDKPYKKEPHRRQKRKEAKMKEKELATQL